MSDAIAFGGLIYLIAAGLIIAAIRVFSRHASRGERENSASA